MPIRSVTVALATMSLLALASAAARAAALPVQPRTFDTSYVKPTGTTLSVAAGGDFQGALNSAQLGDVIVLQAGASYTGPFTLPNKTSGTGWIYVISSAYSSLPGPGQRVGPANAAQMPKIVSPAHSNALVTVANSNHFRFVGIEFLPAAGAFLYNLVTIGNQDTSPATLPSNIVFDRCYVHGDPTGNDIRGIEMDGAYVAVIDSYISGFKAVGTDTQGLWAFNTTGPLQIVDDYIEAAGENVMFGGADSLAATLVPADIEVRGNTMFKDPSWIGTNLDQKNLLEFKAAQRVLATGNTLVNNPVANQDGFALLVTPRNQNGNAPWSIVADITITGNVLTNVAQGVNILGTDNLQPSQETARVLVRNNVLGVTGLGGGAGRAFQVTNGGTDITIDHNTVIETATSGSSALMMADNAPATTHNFVFTNNLSTPTTYGFFGSGNGEGNAALGAQFSNWTFQKNALVGGNAAIYPAGNYFPASVAAVQFTNYSAGNYTLAAGSPYRNAGTDGLDLGATPTANAPAPGPPTNLSVH